MSTHLQLANSTTMAILCGITILIVLLQPVIFMIVAFKRGKELNMTDQEMKEAARSSAIFSIIPSLPIIVSYLLLVPSLGRYFPWLRLSVVGSAAYETMVANMAAEALESAAKAKGWEVKVETQGSIGLENELTAEDVASADMVILTKDIGIKFEERFAGKTIVRVNISDAVKRADAIMSKIEAHLAQTA